MKDQQILILGEITAGGRNYRLPGFVVTWDKRMTRKKKKNSHISTSFRVTRHTEMNFYFREQDNFVYLTRTGVDSHPAVRLAKQLGFILTTSVEQIRENNVRTAQQSLESVLRNELT